MQRREFITGLGSAAAWPVVARAQQADRVRRVGVLRLEPVYDQFTQRSIAALREGLEVLGWNEGRNLQLDIRFAGGDPNAVGPFGRSSRRHPSQWAMNGLMHRSKQHQSIMSSARPAHRRPAGGLTQ